MNYKKLEKPPQIKDDIWRQHLSWMEVIGKQLDENTARRRKQVARNAQEQGAHDRTPG